MTLNVSTESAVSILSENMLSLLQSFSFEMILFMGRHINKIANAFYYALPHAIAYRSYRAVPRIISSIITDSYNDISFKMG